MMVMEKEMFRDREVQASSVKEFIDKYYKPDRAIGRGEEYYEILLASHQRDFDKLGYDIISHHDSVTGQVVAIFKNPANDLDKVKKT